MKRHLKPLLTLCVVTFFASNTPAHAYQVNTSGGKVLHWADADLPLAWYMNMNGFTGLSAQDAESAFKHGMSQWSQQTCTKFRNLFKGTTTKGNRSDGTNVLMFGSLSAGSSTTAITYTRWGSQNKTYTDADIVFRSTKPWSINPNNSQLDLRGTATHEIGHMLGLAHSSVLNATMYSKTSSGPSPRRFLDADDIKGLCTIYPGSSTPPSGTKGSLCGSSGGGVKCQTGLLCVSKTGEPSVCVELCQNGACPNGGKCLNTTSGSQFCACDTNADCQIGQLCTNRNCLKDPSFCTKDADCDSDQTCDAGTCKTKPPTPECLKDADCPNNQTCQQGKCISSGGQRGSLCGSSGGGVKCQSNLLCVNKAGQPAYCLEFCQNGTCPNGGKCLKTTSGSQFCACDSDTDCNAGQTCNNRNCFNRPGSCTKDADCGTGQICKNDQCQQAPPPCTKNEDCASDQICQNGKCVDPPPCQNDTECTHPQICQHGRCVEQPKKGFGEECKSPDDCISALCATISKDTKTYCTNKCTQTPNNCPPAYKCTSSPNHGDICTVSTSGCVQDSDCPPAHLCQQQQCLPKSPENTAHEPARDASSQDNSPTTESPQDKTTTPKDTNTIQDDQYFPDKNKPKTGCQCQTSSPHDIGLLLLLMLALMLLHTRQKTHPE